MVLAAIISFLRPASVKVASYRNRIEVKIVKVKRGK
jgi:hypothetical protein